MRKLYLALVSCLLILMIAACSSEPESAPDSSEKPSNEKVDKKDIEEESVGKYDKVIPVEELEDRDYGGLTFTWAGPLLREINPEESEIKEKWHNRIKDLEEKWNFKFESKTIPYGDHSGEYIRTTLAGDPVGDIVYMHSRNFYPAFAENGLAYPVSDLNIIDFDDPKWVQSNRTSSEYKGSIYSVRPGTTETVIVRDGIWFNKTKFKDLGILSLYELYENGEWTWDKMFEIAELATRDLDNDGKTDVYGFAGGYLPYDLIHNNGADVITKTASGINIDFNNPKIIEALEYYQNARKEHARVFLQPKEEGGWADATGDFRDGRALMIVEDWWISTSYLNEGRMQDEYGFVPFPAGPSNENPEKALSVGIDDSMEIMLSTIENHKEKLEIWDEITNIGTADDWARWTREEYEMGANDAESVDYALLMHENAKTNLILGFPELNGIVGKLFSSIGSGETTVQSALEEVHPQILAAVADFDKNGFDLGITEEEIEETKKKLEDGTYYDDEEKE